MSEYTPGPWWVVHGDLVRTSSGRPIRQSSDQPLAVRVADAHLIAAAPDLLEALRLILDEPDNDLLNTHRYYAMKAVHKAEGACG